MGQQGRRIGIIGGMGPEAGIALFHDILRFDPASRDQDHLPVVLDSDPSIPDRTSHLLGEGPDPLPAMIRSGKRLANAKVELGAVACMTAHAYLAGLREALPFPILSAFEELAREITNQDRRISFAGILATTGSRKSRLFERGLPGISLVWPEQTDQENLVMEAVYGKRGIKAGFLDDSPRNFLVEASQKLIKSGAEIIVSGCTEIPLVLRQADIDVPLFDPMSILAKALVKMARS